MPRLGEIVADRATVAVPFGDSALRVTYRPKVVTPAFQRAALVSQRTQDVDTALCRPLAQLIASWDLTDDDGTPIEPTAEAFMLLPATLLLTVLDAITTDMAPNPSRGGASASGSPVTASSASAPNGTAS